MNMMISYQELVRTFPNSLIKQKWLLIRTDLHPKFRKFSLSSTWQSEWIEIFGEEPPEIEI